jgi:prepilin-type processing-associated H-X9-DG protein
MPVNFHNCPACGGIIAAEAAPGDQARCPLCGQMVTVPEAGGIPPPVEPLQMTTAGGIPLPVESVQMAIADGRRGPAIVIVCLGIVGILVFLLFVRTLSSAMSRSRELDLGTIYMANMRGIGQALTTYAAQNGGAFPEAGADWTARLLDAGLTAPAMLKCPCDKSSATCSYIYIPGGTVGPPNSPLCLLLYDRPGNHGSEGGNMLFMDGHVLFDKSPDYGERINANKPPQDTSPAQQEKPKGGPSRGP